MISDVTTWVSFHAIQLKDGVYVGQKMMLVLERATGDARYCSRMIVSGTVQGKVYDDHFSSSDPQLIIGFVQELNLQSLQSCDVVNE